MITMKSVAAGSQDGAGVVAEGLHPYLKEAGKRETLGMAWGFKTSKLHT